MYLYLCKSGFISEFKAKIICRSQKLQILELEPVCFGFSASKSDSTILKSEKLSFQWCLV